MSGKDKARSLNMCFPILSLDPTVTAHVEKKSIFHDAVCHVGTTGRRLSLSGSQVFIHLSLVTQATTFMTTYSKQ